MGLQVQPEASKVRIREIPVFLESRDKASELYGTDMPEYPGQGQGFRICEFYEVKGPRVVAEEQGAVKARPPPEALPSSGKLYVPEGQRPVAFNKDHFRVFGGGAFRVAYLGVQVKGNRPGSG